MQNEAPVEAAPAAQPVTPAAPAASPATPASPQASPASGEPAKPVEAKPWQVPDAYKDKPWTAKIKSEEDLYKQIDNLTGLVGKKTITIDYATATPEEIKAHHASLAPSDVSAYGFDQIEGINAERMKVIAPIFQEEGLTPYQAKNIATKYSKIEEAALAQATSEEGFRGEMTKSFGEKYEPMVAQVVEAHKAHLTPEDQRVMDAMPNEYLGSVYRLTQKMADAHKAEVAALKKQYGVEENGNAHLNKGGNIPAPDVNVVRAKLREEIQTISNRPHTAEEKQKKIDELQATYAQQPVRK